jgi:hypothetical protein
VYDTYDTKKLHTSPTDEKSTRAVLLISTHNNFIVRPLFNTATMRTKSDNGIISARAISGTRVIILGLDVKGYELPELMAKMNLGGSRQSKKTGTKVKGTKNVFIGFSITRTDLGTGEAVSLNGDGPIQKFLWGDYDVNPGTEYEVSCARNNICSAINTSPLSMTPDSPLIFSSLKYTIRQMTNGRGFMSFSTKSVGFGSPLQVRIKTEDPTVGQHGIYFNRGVAGCHAYNSKFDRYRKWHLVSKYGIPVWRNIINPREITELEQSKEALSWLSRGLEEAVLEFISQTSGSKFQLRAAVYEFTHKETIGALAAAIERGVDVKIIRHCKGVYHPKVKRNSIVRDADGKVETQWIPDTTTDEAEKAIKSVGELHILLRDI